MDLLVSKKLDVRVLNATMEYIYVLELRNGKYYVGKTSDVDHRFQQHKNGTGSVWTRLHPPVKIIERRPVIHGMGAAQDENNTVKDYMKMFGVDNVRGGAYTQQDLPDGFKNMIEMENRTNEDTCFKCGLPGHFSNKCPVTIRDTKKKPVVIEEWECSYCDRTFTTRFGCSVHEKSCKPSPKSKKVTGACYRCGRTSHYSPDCYASTHVDGYDLD